MLKNSAGQNKEKKNPGGSPPAQDDGFQEVRWRKRQSSGEAEHTTKEPAPTTPTQPEFFRPAAEGNGNIIFSGRCYYRSRDGPSKNVQTAPKLS
jgi:hypothetical protein